MPARIRLQILGRFCASVEGPQPRLLPISGPRYRALITYLAMQPGHAETRKRLATLLWADGTDRQARQSLRQSLLRLRKELDEAGVAVLSGDRETVTLDATLLTVDAREFQTLAEAQDDADLESACALYGGDLLEGLDLDVEPFAAWLRSERFRLRTLAIATFERCARQQVRLGKVEAARATAERLRAFDPANATARQLLIDLAAQSREADADPLPTGGTESVLPRQFGQAPTSIEAAVPQRPAGAAAVLQAGRGLSKKWLWAGAAVAAVCLIAIWMPQPTPTGGAVSVGAPEPRSESLSWRSPAAPVPGAAVARAFAGMNTSAIVVLPFSAVPPEAAAASRVARVISDDLINNLSRVPGFRVIARSTAAQYADRPVDVARLGAELGVHYAVEGRTLLEGDKVRIDIALVDVKTRLQVWAERYEHDEVRSLTVQDEIVRALARQLQVSMMEVRGRDGAASLNPTQRDTLGKAWAAFNRFAFFRGGHEAEQLFEEVLRADPQNISALTGLGAFKVVAFNTGQTSVPNRAALLDQAEDLLKQAMALDQQASLPHYFLGMLAARRHLPDEALAYYTRTLELNPSYAPAYGAIGFVLMQTGRLNEAFEHVTYAMRLSPKDHYLGVWSAYAGRIQLELGNDQLAEQALSQAVRLMPNSAVNRATLAAVLAWRDDMAAAQTHAAEFTRLAPKMTAEELVRLLTGMSRQDEHKPKKLLAGVQKAFALVR